MFTYHVNTARSAAHQQTLQHEAAVARGLRGLRQQQTIPSPGLSPVERLLRILSPRIATAAQVVKLTLWF